MLEDIEVLCHSSIKINKGKVIYIDPFRIDKNYNNADIIMITHSHYDHYSEQDIGKVKKENGWVGYIFELNNVRYYIAGDTDITEENRKVKCDVALVPIRRHIYNEL